MFGGRPFLFDGFDGGFSDTIGVFLVGFVGVVPLLESPVVGESGNTDGFPEQDFLGLVGLEFDFVCEGGQGVIELRLVRGIAQNLDFHLIFVGRWLGGRSNLD